MFTLANTTEHVWSSVYPFTLQKSIKITRGKASCAGCYLITAISQREQGLWGSFSSVQLCLTLPYLIEPALNKYITEATRLVGKNLINSSWFDSEQIYICSAGSVHSESVWKMLLCQVLPVLSLVLSTLITVTGWSCAWLLGMFMQHPWSNPITSNLCHLGWCPCWAQWTKPSSDNDQLVLWNLEPLTKVCIVTVADVGLHHDEWPHKAYFLLQSSIYAAHAGGTEYFSYIHTWQPSVCAIRN